VGVRINIDVLNSQSQLFQTKRDLAVARYNVLVGNLKLRQANGTLTSDDLVAVNNTLATNGRATVDSAASPYQPSAATVSPVPVEPTPSLTTSPTMAPPVNSQPPKMSVPPPPPVIAPPTR
jgi:outer membrane protein